MKEQKEQASKNLEEVPARGEGAQPFSCVPEGMFLRLSFCVWACPSWCLPFLVFASLQKEK